MIQPENMGDLCIRHFLEILSVNDTGPSQLGVNFVDGDVEAVGDFFDRFASFGDDTDGASDGFGRDWVISRNHDDLNAC